MAIGEKYAPLGNWLKEHGGDSVKLTFDELNQIIPIPNHAYKNRPSWANLSNPASFCSSWISAGYVVDSISLEEQGCLDNSFFDGCCCSHIKPLQSWEEFIIHKIKKRVARHRLTRLSSFSLIATFALSVPNRKPSGRMTAARPFCLSRYIITDMKRSAVSLLARSAGK